MKDLLPRFTVKLIRRHLNLKLAFQFFVQEFVHLYKSYEARARNIKQERRGLKKWNEQYFFKEEYLKVCPVQNTILYTYLIC